MDYIRLAEACSGLEKVPAKLEKVDIIAKLLRKCKGEELAMVTRLFQGRVFPSWSDKEIGIAAQLMIKALSSSTGVPEQEIEKGFRERSSVECPWSD